jgi:diacylglycerol O-acyltransferase 1
LCFESDFPLIRKGFSKGMATLVVFAFSAIMHEVVISLPFRYIAFHAFFGMLAQAPLIAITKYIDRRYDNAFVGNAVFWCSFCIFGQPMGIIMYYYDLSKFSAAVAATAAAAAVSTSS